MNSTVLPSDFKGGQSMSTWQFAVIFLIGLGFNFGFGIFLESRPDYNDSIRDALDWAIGARIEDYTIYAPTSLPYFLSSVIGLVVFPIAGVVISFTRFTPNKNVEVKEGCNSARAKSLKFGDTPLKMMIIISIFFMMLVFSIFFAGLPGTEGASRRLSAITVYPVLPVFCAFSNIAFYTCYSPLIFTFLKWIKK